MKPILKVIIPDKPAEATVNALFEDIYNKIGSLQKWVSGGTVLDRPHIDSSSTGAELNYAFIYLHCLLIKDALLYVWRYRKRGTYKWSTWFSVENETKIPNLYFVTEYELGVLAIGPSLVKSEWSYTIIVTSAAAPVPSQVTGVVLTNLTMFVDPITGEQMARVRVDWTDNATSELVDLYEVTWTE
jgi:hypothetical protein